MSTAALISAAVAAGLVIEDFRIPTEVQFNAERHRYTLRGKTLPGVTSIQSALGFNKGAEFFRPIHRQRGTAVHRASELYFRGRLDADRTAPAILNYIDSLDIWVEQSGFRPILIEQVVHYYDLFSGTLDLYGWTPADGMIIVDLKSGVEDEKHHMQTAGYAVGLTYVSKGVLPVNRRLCLYLNRDGGKPTPKWAKDRNGHDGNTWLSMVQTYHWGVQHGYYPAYEEETGEEFV